MELEWYASNSGLYGWCLTQSASFPAYEGCPESIQPSLISQEPVTWPWCNLAASQRRPYCGSM